jgi:serine/threonine protein kinase
VDSHAVDGRADIYALGCTLYFLLCGAPPFGTGTMAQRVMKHQTAEPREIRATRADVPERLVAICRKMMAKAPTARFQTAGEVAQALADFIEQRTAGFQPTKLGSPLLGTNTSLPMQSEIGLAPDKSKLGRSKPKLLPQENGQVMQSSILLQQDSTLNSRVGPAASAMPSGIETGQPSRSTPLPGLHSLLDEVLQDGAKGATPGVDPLTGPANWSEPGSSPWTSGGRKSNSGSRKSAAADISYSLWFLIGAGVLLGAIVLGVAYSAISSFVGDRAPATVEYRDMD